MRVEDKVDSDHQPLEVWIKGGSEKGQGRERKRIGVREGMWGGEGGEIFRSNLGGLELGKRGIEDKWKEGEKRVKVAMEVIEEEIRVKDGRKRGW